MALKGKANHRSSEEIYAMNLKLVTRDAYPRCKRRRPSQTDAVLESLLRNEVGQALVEDAFYQEAISLTNIGISTAPQRQSPFADIAKHPESHGAGIVGFLSTCVKTDQLEQALRSTLLCISSRHSYYILVGRRNTTRHHNFMYSSHRHKLPTPPPLLVRPTGVQRHQNANPAMPC